MAKKKSKRTETVQFSQKTKEKIYYRDNMQCIFCSMGYCNECKSGMLLQIKDIMHFIPKSQGGKGIEQNGAVGCRYHHDLMDNGDKGLREDMLKKFEAYLRSIYPDWNKKNLFYKKYDL